MPLETLFSIAGAMAAAGWLMLAAVPRSGAARTVAGILLPLMLAAVYLVLVVRHMPGAPGGLGSFAQVALLFQRPEPLLADWIHYLALVAL